jgi:hypothetical protein
VGSGGLEPPTTSVKSGRFGNVVAFDTPRIRELATAS